jgi:exonuclease SbcD
VQVIVHTEEPARELAAQVEELLPEAVLLSVDEVCAAQQQAALRLGDLPPEVEAPIPELFAEYLNETGVRASTVEDVLSTFRVLHEGADLPELQLKAPSVEVGS